MVTGIGTRDCETVQKGTKSWQGSATQQVQVMEKGKEPNAQSHRSFFFFFSLGSTAGAAHLNDRTVAPKFFIASLHTHTHTLTHRGEHVACQDWKNFQKEASRASLVDFLSQSDLSYLN